MLAGVKVENKQLLVDKFIPKVTSAVPGSPPAALPPPLDADTVRAPLVYESTFYSTSYIFCLFYQYCYLRVLASAGWWEAWEAPPPGNQRPLVVETMMEDLRWAWGEQVHGMWYCLPSVLWYCWLGDKKCIRSVKMFGWWYVCGDDLTGALHVL